MNDTKRQHITQAERHEISIWLKEKKSYRRIGKKLGRHHTTISREVARNSLFCKKTWGSKYVAIEAESKKIQRRIKTNQRHTILLKDTVMYNLIFGRLEKKGKDHGVDEIIGRLKLEGKSVVATTTVYRFIHNYSPGHKKYLRYGRHGYKKRKGQPKRTALKGVPLITERAKSIDNRKDIGHREVDMVVGPQGEKGGLLTLVERKSRLLLIQKVPRATKDCVYAAMYAMLHRHKVKSITSDNGSEFALLSLLGKKLDSLVFRCHPYSSWEKGTNEKHNGFIRWYIKKGTNIQDYSDEFIKEVENKINSKPRKLLNYMTAKEAYEKECKNEVMAPIT